MRSGIEDHDDRPLILQTNHRGNADFGDFGDVGDHPMARFAPSLALNQMP